MTKQCTCGKVCKNIHGLKIHRARMKCPLGAEATQRTGVTPGETQEVPGPESPHSAQNLQVLQTNSSSIKSDRRRIKWPAASMNSIWQEFDDDVDQILEGMAKGEADKKLQVMTTTIVNIAAERFGEVEKKSSGTAYSMNKRAYKAAEERTGLAQLMCILRKNIRVLRRAEWHRRRRRERARKRAAFIANPFKFTKDLLGQKHSGKLASSQEDIDQHLKQTYSDPAREQEAFMDDLTVMTESVPGCRWILKGLEKLVEWARMRFKPIKSRSMVLRKGKWRTSSGTAIPTITEKPVKSLGKVFDCSLRDTTSIQSTCTELDGWLKSVDKSGLPGKFKAWVYQHGILPRILWPLLVYAVPISTVETLERRVSNHLRRWLGLPRSLSSIALYGNTNKLQLPFKSLEEEFKVTRAREVVQYRDASDPKVAKAGIQVRTGRKWRAEEAVQEADARLRQRCLVGVVTRGRAGLGSFPSPQMNTRGKERRRLVQEEVRAAVEETRTCKAVGMKQQGAWTRWENAVERKCMTCFQARSSWEDRLEEAFERKLSKYAGLVSDCHQAGWRARCFPVEVGCRGFAARSLARAFSTLGIEGERKRRAIRSTTDAAERASRWLWLKRGEPWSHGN
ncbi:hypothetical protein N1851_007647 [Merluccius polli]|uniref:Reverse transcriptase n=1 Tax=Merluccius polli TaxID=89951 RepID=A0AA47N2L6_MERPO|nr:hypothetical protein N1851_007647 [Merluccius polli]